MAEQLFGIENLKKMVKFATDFTEQVADALKDGKFSWTEAFGFVDEVMQIPGVVKSWPAIKQELSELSADERTALHQYVVEEFDIPNDKVEAFVENALGWAINAIALVEMWKALKAK